MSGPFATAYPNAVPPLIPGGISVRGLEAEKPKVAPKVAVTQTGTTAATVVANGSAGTITMVSSTLAANATESFTVTNSSCSADSVVLVNTVDYSGTLSTSVISVGVTAISEGSFVVVVGNGGSAALNGIAKIAFLVV
jgi:hypothetical protein